MENKNLTLGSLFDGSGGFPLGGIMAGIEPVWASEIEPFPIRVTTKRIPLMKHYGDVSKMNGAEIEPVDIITFGSPCQSLSVAGKRHGLKHSDLGDEETTRSGLFMEAIRIIREMRESTNGKYPTFAVWENVPGAFSSTGGEDFRTVLEEFCKIKDPTISIPRPEGNKGKWLYAGEIMGDDYSIAWRTFEASGWGVPQRRRRIYLVADFSGGGAGKILFESEGLRGDSEESRNTWKNITRNFKNRIRTTDNSLFVTNSNSYILENHPNDSRIKICEDGLCQSLTSRMGTGGNNVPMVLEHKSVCYALDSVSSNSMKSSNPNSGFHETNKAKTLDTSTQDPTKNQGGLLICCNNGTLKTAEGGRHTQ